MLKLEFCWKTFGVHQFFLLTKTKLFVNDNVSFSLTKTKTKMKIKL